MSDLRYEIEALRDKWNMESVGRPRNIYEDGQMDAYSVASGELDAILAEERDTLGTAQEEFDRATGYHAKWQKAEAQLVALRKVIDEYGSHRSACPLAQWSEGRPTADGGYETMYAGKWYRGDERPACTCGFSVSLHSAALAAPKGESHE